MSEDKNSEKWIQHCCHNQHKLKEVYSNIKFKCQVCKHEKQGMRYRCNSCSSYEIDTICGTLQESLSTFTHPDHPLALRPTPFLPHKCCLCKDFVSGMAYRCEAPGCKFFLHPLCSQFQAELYENHHRHPPHRLRLRSLASKKCDVCEKKCEHWRYHCGICDVHIHLACLAPDTPKTDAAAATAGDGQNILWTIIAGMIQMAQL